MPRFLLVLLLLVISLSQAQAGSEFEDKDKLNQWLSHYYQQPQPERIGEAMLSASQQGLIRTGSSAAPVFGFMAGWMKHNPDGALALVKTLAALPPKDRPALVSAVWYAQLPQTPALLEQIISQAPEQKSLIEHMQSTKQPDLLDTPMDQGPWVTDALWGYFMATGDEAPIVRIITILPWSAQSGAMAQRMAGNAAKWSLVSNAIQHERVLAICRAQLKLQKPDVAAILQEVITAAEAKLKAPADSKPPASNQAALQYGAHA